MGVGVGVGQFATTPSTRLLPLPPPLLRLLRLLPLLSPHHLPIPIPILPSICHHYMPSSIHHHHPFIAMVHWCFLLSSHPPPPPMAVVLVVGTATVMSMSAVVCQNIQPHVMVLTLVVGEGVGVGVVKGV